MTLLVSWVAIDPHSPTSLYIASDSQISWGNNGRFPMGRKVFAFRKWPVVIGYCGDVLFPSIVLNQIVELADHGMLFNATDSSKKRFDAIVKGLNNSLESYPKDVSGLADNSLSIIYASREPSDHRKFMCGTISWSTKSGWEGKEAALPGSSGVLFAVGSGKDEFTRNYERYQAGQNRNTSRNIFQCFCDTLKNIRDPSVGGSPQLVGVTRKPKSDAINYGIVFSKKRYFLGAHIDNLKNFDNIEWRNERFERCQGSSMKKLQNAKSQPDLCSRL